MWIDSSNCNDLVNLINSDCRDYILNSITRTKTRSSNGYRIMVRSHNWCSCCTDVFFLKCSNFSFYLRRIEFIVIIEEFRILEVDFEVFCSYSNLTLVNCQVRLCWSNKINIVVVRCEYVFPILIFNRCSCDSVATSIESVVGILSPVVSEFSCVIVNSYNRLPVLSNSRNQLVFICKSKVLNIVAIFTCTLNCSIVNCLRLCYGYLDHTLLDCQRSIHEVELIVVSLDNLTSCFIFLLSSHKTPLVVTYIWTNVTQNYEILEALSCSYIQILIAWEVVINLSLDTTFVSDNIKRISVFGISVFSIYLTSRTVLFFVINVTWN